MMLAGGALTFLMVLLPPAATGSDTLILGFGGFAAVLGASMLLSRRLRHPSDPVAGALAALGTALITVGSREGGLEGTGTADNEILYLWVCLFSFYFLTLRHALLQLAWVGIAYAWLLEAAGVGLDEGLTRWLVTLGTLLVAGLVIARLRDSQTMLVGRLAERARRDSLTGMLNRRALVERGALEFARSRREGSAISFLAADIDGFKAFNDAHGHPAGDRMLLRVAAALDAATREVDAVVRLGGDEFGVLLPATSLEEAAVVAERLRGAVDDASDERTDAITLSIGVAAGPPPSHSLDELWQAADEALYEAKRAGGNTVRVASAADRGAMAIHRT